MTTAIYNFKTRVICMDSPGWEKMARQGSPDPHAGSALHSGLCNCPWVWTLQTWARILAGIPNLGQVVGVKCQVTPSGQLLVSIPEGSLPSLTFISVLGGDGRARRPCLLAMEGCALLRRMWVWDTCYFSLRLSVPVFHHKCCNFHLSNPECLARVHKTKLARNEVLSSGSSKRSGI